MSPTTSQPIARCQICKGSDLRSIIFIGYIPPVNAMPDIGKVAEEQIAYPLELFRCPNCTLVQIGLQVDPKVVFPVDYPYRSSSTRILREDFADLYQKTSKLLHLTAEDLIVDIGSNDGTLLSNFQRAGHRVLGIEPSQAAEEANARGITTRMEFFGAESARAARRDFGPARLITATNVFAHIPDVPAIVEAILELLASKGVFVSESHYLLDLINTLQYDTIYHEHLRHYTLKSLSYLFKERNLEIFNVERIPTHGGSIRVYAARPGDYETMPCVKMLLDEEDRSGLTDGSLLQSFRRRVVQSKLALYTLLDPIIRNGDRIYGIGAPSRASTLINYLGLDEGILECVMEIKSSPKVGRYIPGTRIPVLDEQKLFHDQPEYALFLSWHIAEELSGNLRRKGYKGKFIIPLPVPKILT